MPGEPHHDSKFPSIKEVAKHAGVSPSTASRVLTRRGYTSLDARIRVERAAQELGYEPHLAAQALKSRSSRMVGLVIQDITNPFYSFVAKGIADVMGRAGFVLLLSDSREDREQEAESLRVMMRSRVGAVIVTPTLGNAEALQSIQQRGIALVQIDRTVPHVVSDTVVIDNFAGSYAAMKHLLDLGHTRIGVIAGPWQHSTGRLRLLGSRAAMQERKVPMRDNYVKASDFSRDTGYLVAGELLDENPRPTAVFAHNNVLAESLLTVIAERKLRVPEDVAVVGFDDPPWAQLVSPPLTVIRQPAYEIGATAAELLVRRFTRSEAATTPVNILLQPSLVVRESCGAHLPGEPPEEIPIERPVDGSGDASQIASSGIASAPTRVERDLPGTTARPRTSR
jgi:LacI family transcriptional regulator